MVGLEEFVDEKFKTPMPTPNEILDYSKVQRQKLAEEDLEWTKGFNSGEICLLFSRFSLSNVVAIDKTINQIATEIKGQVGVPAYTSKKPENRLKRSMRVKEGETGPHRVHSEPV
jgi:hypothetical protein